MSVYSFPAARAEWVGKQYVKSKHLASVGPVQIEHSPVESTNDSTALNQGVKFLRKISRKSGLQYTDEEVHDMGVRLLSLCHIATSAKNREDERGFAQSNWATDVHGIGMGI